SVRTMKATTAKPVRAPINMLRNSKTRSSRCAKCETHQRKGAFHHNASGGFPGPIIRARSFRISSAIFFLTSYTADRVETGTVDALRNKHSRRMTRVQPRTDGL